MTDTATPSFESDIRPLFRESDRDSMLAVFDLWSFDDVKANADKILAAVRAGSMPCDMQWPEQRGAYQNNFSVQYPADYSNYLH